MSVRPNLTTIRRPSDGLTANPHPKPEPIPEPDEEDVASRDARPPLPAGVGHYPPRLPPKAQGLEDAFPPPKARERSVSKSVRIPVSLLDQLESVCRARQIEFSSLVLHYVASGLRKDFASEKTAH